MCKNVNKCTVCYICRFNLLNKYNIQYMAFIKSHLVNGYVLKLSLML